MFWSFHRRKKAAKLAAMPNTSQLHGAKQVLPPLDDTSESHRNLLGLPTIRLTTLIPLVLALVVFAITLTVAWVAADVVDRRNTALLGDKARVFLDATAGHFADTHLLTETAMQDALASALSFRTMMGEEAVAVGWMNGDTVSVVAMPEGAAALLTGELRETLDGNRSGPFHIREDGKGALSGIYGDSPTRFAIAGLFDTSELFAANEAVHRAALGLSLLIALATAFACYAVGRMAISPLVSVANRLAKGDTGGTNVPRGQYLSSELLEIETILTLRREDDKSREDMAQRLAQMERDQVLARLAATMAHEVRNPLAGIRNAFSTLRRFGDDKSVRNETLDIIEGGLDSLQRLTDVTLSTYRRRSGVGILGASDIEDLALIVSPQVKERNLSLHWSIPASTIIHSDTDAVRQMLVNLLLNACKASPDGSVVRVGASTDAKGVKVSISDEGAGLPEGVRQHLQAGQGVDVLKSRDLGLWVVHSLADELGAAVSVESQVGQGTTVSVLFPHPLDGTAGAQTK